MTTAVRDQDVVAGAVLRVWAGEEVVGGAFLVAPDLVATAATVVADALGVHPGTTEHPAGTVRLDFPLLHAEPDGPVPVAAQVERWSPTDGTALLRLAGALPPGVRMPPLRRVEPLGGRSFSVLGFPAGLADGVWTTGRIDAGRIEAGQDGLRHRLHASPGEQPVDAGFSGTPVWEAGTGAVAGMVVTRRGGDPELVPIDDVLGLDPERLPCPYLGLRTFDEAQADTFFGRDDDIERLVDLLARQPVVAVAGPSGAGKSSLVRAGLVPRLRAAGAEIVYLRAEPGARLAETVPEAGDRDLVLVIDQFEELAALDPAAARELLEAVVRRTDQGSGSRVRAVLTLRWTTLDEMLTPELIDTLDAGTVLVGPLERARLQEAIVRPAEQPPGLAFEQGLVETILDDAGAEPGRLPLVESLLADLWERRAGGFLTLRDYEAAGGVAGALAQHAETVAAALPPGGEAALRRLVTALARPDRDGRFVRRPVPLDQLPEAQRALVPALTAGRLLIVSRSARGTDVVEFAHQALVDHWPRLRSWLAADREFLAWREQVDLQRERWEAEGRADPALLRGVLLAGASEWLPAREDDVPRADLDFLRRSRARQRREVRRWRIVTAVVAVLTLSAAVLSVISVRSGDQIAAQLATANADTLGREAQARNPDDPATAAQLALSAWREDPRNPQARTALAQSYLAMQAVERELPGLTGAPITDMLLGGDTAILVADPHPIVVTGLSGPAPQHRELTGVPADRQIAVSADGRWLAAQTPDRTVLELHDLTTAAPPVPLPGIAGTEVGLAPILPGRRAAGLRHRRRRRRDDPADPGRAHRHRRAARRPVAARRHQRRRPDAGLRPRDGASRRPAVPRKPARGALAGQRRGARHPACRRPVRARGRGRGDVRARAGRSRRDRHPGRDAVRRLGTTTDRAHHRLRGQPGLRRLAVRQRGRTGREGGRPDAPDHRPAHRGGVRRHRAERTALRFSPRRSTQRRPSTSCPPPRDHGPCSPADRHCCGCAPARRPLPPAG